MGLEDIFVNAKNFSGGQLFFDEEIDTLFDLKYNSGEPIFPELDPETDNTDYLSFIYEFIMTAAQVFEDAEKTAKKASIEAQKLGIKISEKQISALTTPTAILGKMSLLQYLKTMASGKDILINGINIGIDKWVKELKIKDDKREVDKDGYLITDSREQNDIILESPLNYLAKINTEKQYQFTVDQTEVEGGVPCIVCKSTNTTVYWQQARGADESDTAFFACHEPSCKKRWQR